MFRTNNFCLPCGVVVSVVGVLLGTGEFGGVVGLLIVALDLLEEKRAKRPRLTGVAVVVVSSFFSSSFSTTVKRIGG